MILRNNSTIVNTVIVISIVGWLFYLTFVKDEERVGFIYNGEVFQEFNGTKHLERKLKLLKDINSKKLDSVAILAKTGNLAATNLYPTMKANFDNELHELEQKYNAEVWQFINRSIKNFGNERGITLIFGASGDGSLMFADSTMNLTKEVIDYLNEDYQNHGR